MCKIKIRKRFIHLKLKYSYKKCKSIIKEEFDYDVSIETLKRWKKRFEEETSWTFEDLSRKPKNIHYKITEEIEKRVLKLRKKTGYGCEKLADYNLGISKNSINLILKKHNLTRKEHNRAQRQKYVRFQREHSNSLWHIDDSEFGEKEKIIAVIDDCSRYCLGILKVDSVTTFVVTQFLDELIKKFGFPKQIISDNGSPYGGKSKWSKFDIWCRRRKIEHIRTKVKRPQTNGKVERFFGTLDTEIRFCDNDLEYFRYIYNTHRLHRSLFGKTPTEKFNLVSYV